MNSSQLEALLKFLSSDKPYIRQGPEEFRLNRNVMTQASRNSKKEILEAVKLDGYALRNASTLLCNDKEVVMAAIHHKGLSLLFASSILQDDKELVLVAIKSNSYSIKFASEALRNDLEFIYEAYNIYSNIIKYIDKKLIKQHKYLQKLLEDFESEKTSN